MRKIEILVPIGRGSSVAKVVEEAGACDTYVLITHGPKEDKDVVSASVHEDKVDKVINHVQEFAKTQKINADLRLWEMNQPLKAGNDETRVVPFEELKTQAYHSSTVDLVYVLMIALSSILAALGLLQDSAIVIIGAMIIAPLLRPIMTASLATVSGDLMLFLRGFLAMLVGVIAGTVAVFLVMMALFVPYSGPTQLITTISQLNVLTIGIAVVAGLIAAVSMISRLSETLAGVSIAVALVPPMAAFGINSFGWLMGLNSFSLALSAFLVVVINCLAINVAGTLVFYVAGMAPRGKAKLLTTEFKIALLLLLVFSIPFVYVALESYSHAVKEEEIKAIVQDFSLKTNATVQSLEVIQGNPLKVKIVLISKNQPMMNLEQRVDEEIETKLDVPVETSLIYLQSQQV
jgi:uncharacterized hydrophobic protein (TIGR00271 family)